MVVREDAPGDRRLVAYVVPREGTAAAMDMATLKSCAGGALPEYMVPGAFVVLEALPLTPNGKVDRRPCPRPATRPWAPRARTTWRRARRSRRCWPASGPRCSASSGSACSDDFFELRRPLAARHPAGLAGARRPSGSSCRCARCSRRRPSPSSRGEVEEARRADRGPGAPPHRAACRATAGRCRSPSPRSGSGSSTSSSRGERRRLQHPGRRAPERRPRRRRAPPALGEVVRRHEALRTDLRRRSAAGPSRGSRQPVEVPFAEVDLRGACRKRARPRRRGWRAETRRGRSTSPRARCCGRPCCGWRHRGRRARLRSSPCTTSSPTAGRWACWSASWRRSTARSPPGEPSPLPAPARPVRRLRGLAARVAPGRGARPPARLLAGASSPGDLPVLELPTDRPRPAVQTFRGASDAAVLPAGLAERRSRRSAGARARRSSWRSSPAFQALLAPPHRPGRRAGRHADRRPQPRRDRGADRLLRQHPGAARRPRGRTRRSASCWRGCARRRSAPTPTRTCRSRSWSRSCSRSATSPARRCSRCCFNVLNVTPRALRAAGPRHGARIEAPPPRAKFDLTLYARRAPGRHRPAAASTTPTCSTRERMAGFAGPARSGCWPRSSRSPETPVDERLAGDATPPGPCCPIRPRRWLSRRKPRVSCPSTSCSPRRAAAHPDAVAVARRRGALDLRRARRRRRTGWPAASCAAGLQPGEVVAIGARRAADAAGRRARHPQGRRRRS